MALQRHTLAGADNIYGYSGRRNEKMLNKLIGYAKTAVFLKAERIPA